MTDERYAQLVQARSVVEEHDGNISAAAKALGIARKTLEGRYKAALSENVVLEKDKIKEVRDDNKHEINYLGTKISTPEELLEQCEIDTEIWEIDRITINTWEVAGKRNRGQSKVSLKKKRGGKKSVEDALKWDGHELWKTPLRQIKVTLRRKSDERQAIQAMLDEMREESFTPVKRKKIRKSGKRRIALEIAIMDPHMGMECLTPEGDHKWDLDLCEQFYLYSVDELIRQAQIIGTIEEIHWIFGNDFNHVDNLAHSTTGGTPQPEAVPQHRSIKRGKELAIAAVEQMLQVAPVHAYQIPGNHDRQTSFMQGLILDAYFHNHPDFTIDCEMSPFKKFRYGASLVGMEHGHSISPIRLAALMANEWKWDFAETHYHEWHCGDQHRKGSSKPAAFEEQGVSIEFLAGLVAPNEWHRLKSFNFQKRAANGFVWDYDCGQTHRLTVNISKYTGQFLGRGYDEWLRKQKAR